MKKLILFFILFYFLFSLPLSVLAQKATPTQVVTLPKTAMVEHDYFAAGKVVILSGVVYGDAYVAGGNVIVEGTVTGDLLTAGGAVDIRGTVEKNVRAAGGNINISGAVGENVSVAGGNVTISDAARVGGNLVSAAGNVSVFAPVKDITIAAANATLGSIVKDNVTAVVKHMIVTPNGKIAGNLTYWSDIPVELQAGSMIGGQTIQKSLPQHAATRMQNNRQVAEKVVAGFIGFFVFLKVMMFFGSLIIGLIFLKLCPVYAKNIVVEFKKEPWKALGIGFLTVIALPVLGVLLCISIIGIPAGIAAFMALAVLGYLAHLVVSLIIGVFIVRKLDKTVSVSWKFSFGLLVYVCISFIPVVGKLLLMFLGFMAIGVLVSQKLYVYRRLKEKKII